MATWPQEKLACSRFSDAIIRAILDGSLTSVATSPDPIFGLGVPKSCPGVENDVLNPRSTWPNEADYDQKAKELAARFDENFKQYEESASTAS